MFKNLKIGRRLGLGFGVILAIMTGVIVIGIMALQKTQAELEAVVIYENYRTQLANDMIIHAQETSMHVRAILLLAYGKQSQEMMRQEQNQLAETRKEFNANYSELEKLCCLHRGKGDQCIAAQLAGMKALADSSRKLQDNGVALALAGRMADATAAITGKAFPVMQRWIRTTEDLIDNENKRTILAYEKAHKRYARMRTLMLALGALAIALALAMAIALTRSIIVPLKVATRLVLSRDQTVDLSGYEEGREEFSDMILAFSRNNVERQRLEEARLLSESSLREILNSLDGLVYVADMKTYETLFVNKYGKDIWGDFTGKTCWQNLQSGQKGPCSFCTNDRLLRPDGTPAGVHVWEFQNTITGKWYECRDSAIRWPDDRMVRMEIATDITGRKRAEQELSEAKALVEAVVENIPHMVFLKEATDLRFVMFNRAGEELLGYERAALMGKNNLDLFPPEQAAHFMAKDREVLDGEAGVLDIPEEPIQTAKQGQRLLHTKKVCIRGADGTTKFLLGISEDITERKKSENELRKMSAAVEQSANVIVITDLDANIVYANQAFADLTGYSREEAIGKNPRILKSGEMDASAYQQMWQLLQSGGKWTGEFHNKKKNGDLFWEQATITSIRDEQGKPVFYMAVKQDITEWRRAQQELQISEQRFQQVIENIGEWVWETDSDGLYTYSNNTVESILGYRPDELVGKMHFDDLFAPDIDDDLRAAAKDGFSRRVPMMAFANPNLHKNGRVVALETNCVPFFGPDGAFLGYRGADKDITMRRALEDERERLISELQDSLDNIKTLKGLVPICSSCKKIRDDKGYWQQVEVYVAKHTEADFSHGLCDECAHTLYPEYFADKKNPGSEQK